MDNKKILIVLIVIVAVVTVAAAFVMNNANTVNANTVKVGGFDFYIPEEYSENEKYAVNGSNETQQINGEKISYIMYHKGFETENSLIEILVFEFDSPKDAKKLYDKDTDPKYSNFTEKTISGHKGAYIAENGVYDFCYCKDNCYIVVATNNESIVESIIPK